MTWRVGGGEAKLRGREGREGRVWKVGVMTKGERKVGGKEGGKGEEGED